MLPHRDRSQLIEKRMSLMFQVWKYLTDDGIVDDHEFRFSEPLAREVVQHYVDDVIALTTRYKIDDKIQLHKIAGLMTSLIIRYRPIIPLLSVFEKNSSDMYINELFSIFHGLAICGEYSLKICENMVGETWFDLWFNDFVYLLHCRNHTPESLILIYETLSYFKFNDNFETFDL